MSYEKNMSFFEIPNLQKFGKKLKAPLTCAGQKDLTPAAFWNRYIKGKRV